MDKRYSEVKADEILQKNRQWTTQFKTTRSFKKLTQPEKKATLYITNSFMGLTYKFFLREPRQITASSTKEVILNMMPEKIAATDVFMQSVVPVLRRYFVFLGVQRKISNSDTLVKALDSIDVSAFVKKASDPHYWNSDKKSSMAILMGFKSEMPNDKVQEIQHQKNFDVPLVVCMDYTTANFPENVILLTDKVRQKYEKLIKTKIKM